MQPNKIHIFHHSCIFFYFFFFMIEFLHFCLEEVYHITIKKNAKIIGSQYFIHEADVKRFFFFNVYHGAVVLW